MVLQQYEYPMLTSFTLQDHTHEYSSHIHTHAHLIFQMKYIFSAARFKI